MGFEIDINKLAGKWKELAQKADSDKDGTIKAGTTEADELYKEVGRLSPEERRIAVSIFTGKEPSGASGSNDGLALSKNEKKSLKATQDDALNVVNSAKVRGEFEKSGDWAELAENAKDALLNRKALANESYTKQLAEQITQVANVMSQLEYHDRDSVMKLYKNAKDKLNIQNDDPFKEFKLNLLEAFANFAEARQQKIEKDMVKNAYDALTQEPPKDTDTATKYLKGMFHSKLVKEYKATKTEDEMKQLKSDPEAMQKDLEKFMADPKVMEKFMEDPEVKEFKLMLYKPAKNSEEAMKIIKNYPKFKGSYFEDNHKYSVSEKIHHNPEVQKKKGAITQVEQTTVMQQARNTAWKAIKNQLGKEDLLSCQKDENGNPIPGTGKKITDYKTVRNAAKAELSHDGKLDKYVEKAFTGELTFGQKFAFEESHIKSFEKTVAAYTRAEEAKQKEFVEAEFYGELKQDSVFQALLGGGLITRNEKKEGQEQTYNITNLSNLIRDYIGADLEANRQNKNFEVMAEVTRVKNALYAITEPHTEMSDKDASHLIKLCGFDVESKNWASNFYDALIGTVLSIPGTVGAALATDAASKMTASAASALTIPVDITLHSAGSMHADFDLGGSVGWNRISDMYDDFMFGQTYTVDGVEYNYDIDNLDINPTENGFTFDYKYDIPKETKLNVEVDQDTLNDNIKKEEESNVPGAIMTGVLINLGMNMLRALMKDNSFEKPVVAPIDSKKFGTITAQQYKMEYLANNKTMKDPQVKQAFSLLVDAFTEKDKQGKPKKDGKFDAEGYQQLLDKYKGDGGVLNADELITGLHIDPPKPEPVEEPEPTKTIEQDTTKTIVVDPTKPTPVKENFAAIKDDDNISGKHTSWEIITKEVYGDQFPKDQKLRTRMYKVMQGMNEEKLTLEQLQELAEISMKKIRNVKTFTDLNGKKYMDPADYAKKAKEAFKDVEFLKDYNFNYETFAENVCRGTIGDKDGMLILPEVLYSVKTEEDGTKVTTKITRQQTPSPAPRKKSNGNGGGRTIPKRGTAGTVGEGKVKEGDNKTRRTSKKEAQDKIHGGYKPKKFNEI